MGDTVKYDFLYTDVLVLIDALKDFIDALGDRLKDLAEIIEDVKEKILNEKNKPKFKPVLKLIKPYKPPFIKIRARARSNI